MLPNNERGQLLLNLRRQDLEESDRNAAPFVKEAKNLLEHLAQIGPDETCECETCQRFE